MNYSDKLQVANNYLFDVCGLTWDDLPDINSLHDCDSIDEITGACNERLIDSGFPEELLYE